MKNVILLLFAIMYCSLLFGQNIVPQGFNYQAIARDSLGNPIATQNIIVRFGLYPSQYATAPDFEEEQSINTDQFGLFSAVIGQGTLIQGVPFTSINWASASYYIETKIKDGLNYVLVGTRQPLLSVPYAMVAKEAIYAVPAGTIVPFGGTTIPTGWLLCDGTNYTVAQYPGLYAAIGTNFGGVSGANFNVPDFRGMFLRGAGTNSVNTDATGNAFSGGAVGYYQADKMQGHKHSYNDPVYGGKNAASGTAMYADNFPNVLSTTTPINDGANGTPRTGNETKPASYSVNYIIKY